MFGSAFGKPAGTTTAGGFGAAPTATSGFGGAFGGGMGAFGQQQQQQQPAATTAGGFGSGFGAQAAQPATGGGAFGSTAAAPITGGLFGAKPATGAGFGTGLFGQQAPTATAGSGFGANATAPATSAFGFNPAASGSAASAAGGSMFGARASAPAASMFQTSFLQPQQQQQQQQAMVPPQPSIVQDLEAVMAAYDPNDSRCRFRHPFYNLVPVEDAPRYTKPANVTEGLWKEAVEASPDPKCMVPVFASGFEDLQKRIEYQNRQTAEHSAKLEDLQADLETLQQKHQIEINGRLIKYQREHIRLTQKVIRIMRMVQILRSRGHTNLTRDEEELRSRFEALLKQMHAPALRGYLDEMAAHVKTLKNAQRAVHAPASKRIVTFEVVNEQALADMFKVLQDMQMGLQQLTEVLQNDLKAVEVISKGYTAASVSATAQPQQRR